MLNSNLLPKEVLQTEDKESIRLAETIAKELLNKSTKERIQILKNTIGYLLDDAEREHAEIKNKEQESARYIEDLKILKM